MLVEFVANAYDADAKDVNISIDKGAIETARHVLKKKFEAEKAVADASGAAVLPLDTRTLEESLTFSIQDSGCGMSRSDLQQKFLIAGRRRRAEEPAAGHHTPGGRLLMGRKGLGKLAGFGVGKTVEITTRTKGDTEAHRVTLDYDEILRNFSPSSSDVLVKDEVVKDHGLPESGTRIVISRLMYDPLKSRLDTIREELADHFSMINPADFAILLNNEPIPPQPAEFAFAWPSPELPLGDFIDKELDREEGGKISFKYRLRFMKDSKALPAARRGVRVYAHNRLAAAPSLLLADTNMHGFRMTDYLDGVVVADFIDEEKSDYIATDRQTLRWDSPLLSPLRDFISKEIKEACKQYQGERDVKAVKAVEGDAFTMDLIKKQELGPRDEKLAIKMASLLKSAFKQGVTDPEYKTRVPILIQSVGRGEILSVISKLAAASHPDLPSVVDAIDDLTRDELDHFVTTVKGRLKGIDLLQKTIGTTGVGASGRAAAPDNEKEFQKLLQGSPWLIDPTYTQFLTADATVDVMFDELAKELAIGTYATTTPPDRDRPDLVFLLLNGTLPMLVIVELKSSNVELESANLDQLLSYMSRARDFLDARGRTGVPIRGQLIGRINTAPTKAKGILGLRERMKEAGQSVTWRVRDYTALLTDAKQAHADWLKNRPSP